MSTEINWHDEYLAAVDAWYVDCMTNGFSPDNPRPRRDDFYESRLTSA